MPDQSADHLQTPPDPSEDMILGETTGEVVVFYRTHGFIRTARFSSVFIHNSELAALGLDRLEPGYHIRAQIRKGQRGRYAKHVQVLSEPVTGGEERASDASALSLERSVTNAIARHLGEREPAPLAQIFRLIRHIGPDMAWDLVEATDQVEAQGGMLLPNGSRRRTPGGVFFTLAQGRLIPEDRDRIFPRTIRKPRPKRPRPATEPPPVMDPQPTPEPVPWAMRGPLIDEARSGQGRATSVKVTVIGRPKSVVERGSTVILMLIHSGPLPSAPKGVPVPAVVPETTYTVYVGAKQWRGVVEAIKDPEDSLIIEGAQIWDAEQQAIAVYTTKITTRLQQRAKRAAPGADQAGSI